VSALKIGVFEMSLEIHQMIVYSAARRIQFFDLMGAPLFDFRSEESAVEDFCTRRFDFAPVDFDGV